MDDRDKEEQHKMEHGRQDGRLKKNEGLQSADGAVQKTDPQSAKGTPKCSIVSPKTPSKFGALNKPTQIPTNGRTHREKGLVQMTLRSSEESNNRAAKNQEDPDSRNSSSSPDTESKNCNDFTSRSISDADLESKTPCCRFQLDPAPPPVYAVVDALSIGVLKSLRAFDRSSSVPAISSLRSSGPTPSPKSSPRSSRPRHSFSELLRLSSTNLASVPESNNEDASEELHGRQTTRTARRLSLSSQDIRIEWASTRGNPLSRIAAGGDRHRLLVATSADRLSSEEIRFRTLSDSGQESLSVSDNSAEGVELGRIPTNADEEEEEEEEEEELAIDNRVLSMFGGGRRNESVEVGNLGLNSRCQSVSCPALNVDDDVDDDSRLSTDSYHSSTSCESLVTCDATSPPPRPPPPVLETSQSALTRSSFNERLEPRFRRYHSSSSELSSTETLQNCHRTGPSNRLQGWRAGRSLSMSTLHLRCSHEDDLDGLSRRDGAKHYGSVDQIFYDKGEFKVVHCKAPEPNGQRERSTRTKQERETKAQQLVQSQDQGFRTSQVVGPALGNVPDVESENGSSDISKIRVESEDFFYSSRTHFENDMKSDDTTAEKTTPVLMIPSRTFYDDAPPIALQGPAADLRYLPAELKDRMLSRQFEEAAQLENESNEPATNGKVTGATASRNGCGNSTTVPAQKNRKDVAELVHLHGEANKQTVRQSTVIIPALTVLPGVLESCNSVEQDRRVAAQIPVSGSADSHKETTATDHDQEQKTKAKSLLSAMETRLKVTKEEAFIANDSREKTEMQVQNDETHVVISADEEEDHVQTDIQCPSVTTDAAENRDATVRRPSKENNSNFQEYFSTQSEQKTAAKTDNETLRQQQQLLLRSEQLQNERLEDLGQPGVLQQNQANGILADNENWQQLRPVRDNRRDEDTFCGRMDTIEVIYEDEELILPERSSELEGIEYVKTREDEDAYGDESKLNINEENDYNRDWTASWMSRKRYSDSYFGLAKPCEIITESAEDVSVDPENSRYLGTSDWNLQQGDNSVETLPTTDGLHNNCGDDDADDDDGDIGEVDFISTESIFGDFDELAVSRDHWLWRRRDWQRCLSASELEYVDPLDWYEGRSLSSGCILMPNCFEPNQHAGSTDSITYFFLGPEDSCPSRRHSSASVYAAAPTEERCETGTSENVPGSSRKRRLSLPVCRLTPSQPKAVEIIDHTLFSSSTNEGRLSENNTLEKESASIPDWKSSVGERILPIGSSGQLNRRLVKRNSLGSGRLDCRQTTFVNFKNRKISPSGSNTEIPSTPENITRIRHPLASDNSLNLNAQTLLGRKLIRHVASDSTTAPVDSHASTREVVSTETSISAANVTLGATSKKFFLFSSPALNSYPSTKTAETQTYPETKVIEVQTSPNEISARAHFVWSSSTTESVKPTNIDATASLDSLADVKASAVPLYSDSYGTADGADSNRVPPSLVGSQDLGSQITSNRSTTPDMYYDSTSIHEDAMSERNMPNGRSVNRLNEQTDEITHEHKSSYRTSSSSSNRENQLTSTATTGKEIRYYDRPIRSNDNAWHSDLTNPPPTKHLCSPIRPLHRSFVDDVIENTYGVTSPQLNGLLQRSTSRFSQRNALTDGRHAVVDSHRSRDDIFSTDIRCDLPKYERSGRHFSMFNTDSFSFGDSLPEAPGRYTSGNRMEHDRPAAASNLCSLRGNEATRNESVDWENYLKYSNDNDNRAKNRFSLTNTDFDTDVNFREENTVTTFDDNLQYNESFGSSNNTRLQHSSTNNRRELQLEKNWSDSRRRKEYSRDFSSAGTSALSFPLVQTGELTFLSPPEFSSGYQVPERDPAREPNKGRDTWTTTTIDLSQPFYDRLSQDIRHRGEDIIGSSTASSSLETNVWTEERNTLRNRRSTNVHSNEPSFVRDDDEIGRLRRERRRLLRLLVADVNASEMRTEYVETELRLQLRLTDRLLRSLHDDDDCTWII